MTPTLLLPNLNTHTVRRKALKKEAFALLPNSFMGNPHIAGQWQTVFGRPRPLVVELGCGKADFMLALARQQNAHNYLGLDVKPHRLYHGARLAYEMGLDNACFLQEDAQGLDMLFAPGEVTALWVTFPDPYPKLRHERRRLVSPWMLERYRKVLLPGGTLDFKTDNAELFEYGLESLAAHGFRLEYFTNDLHELSAEHLPAPEALLRTEYEARFMGQGLPIHYVRARVL